MRTFVLDRSLYPRDCIDVALREFESLCQVSLGDRPNGLHLEIEPRPGAPPETVEEFLNFLLCAALEQHLAES